MIPMCYAVFFYETFAIKIINVIIIIIIIIIRIIIRIRIRIIK